MADIELVIKIPEIEYEHITSKEKFCSLEKSKQEWLVNKILNYVIDGTPLTPDMLADLLMEERIRGELKHDISYSKDIIDDVWCKLTVDIIDRRPCYCGAGLMEVWRESEG